MVTNFLIALFAATAKDPDWMGSAAEMSDQVTDINTFAGTMGGMGWTLPVGVMALVVLKLAPSIGQMIQAEHELSIERRRRRDISATQRAELGVANERAPDQSQ